jgi:predicted nucleotidyltransferase
MRLSEFEIKAIIQTITVFDSNAEIFLYGSRCHDDKKGGDIDLAILSEKIDRAMISRIRIKLHDLIGEQKIDIIARRTAEDAFIKMAVETGVRLNE